MWPPILILYRNNDVVLWCAGFIGIEGSTVARGDCFEMDGGKVCVYVIVVRADLDEPDHVPPKQSVWSFTG